MPCASSWIAQLTISSTDRLWPRWMTSHPEACRIRRMMLIDASWPSKRLAAVTKRTLLMGLKTSGWRMLWSFIANLFWGAAAPAGGAPEAEG